VLELGPEAVSREVAARLARLPHDASEILRAAAILGDGSSLSVAAALTSIDAIRALAAASRLVEAGLLSSEDPVEFRHPVVRTAVLARMRTSERVGAHRRAAAVLIEHGARPEQAAGYLLDTVPAADPFVVDTLRAAGARSVAQGASDSAVGDLRRALAEPPREELRADVLHELGIAELNSGSPSAIESLRASVEALGDEHARPDLVLAYARSLLFLGDMRAASELLASTRHEDSNAHGSAQHELQAHLLMAAQHHPDLRATAERLAAAAVREDEVSRHDRQRSAAGRACL
jgi:hypothetical protein